MTKGSVKTKLSVFILVMMHAAIILNLRGLPLLAREGYSLIFYLLFSVIFFLFPSALVSAELATGWPHGGGVYRWVKEAFGDRLGFVAIWLQWIQNIVLYPTILAFTASAFSYLIPNSLLSQNKVYTFLVVVITFWGATLLNLRGIKVSARLSTLAASIGIILPIILLIVFGACWVFMKQPLAFDKHVRFIPDFTRFSRIAFLAGIVLLFSGIEVTAVHACEVKDFEKNYPKAIFLSALIVFVVFALGALSVAAVLPAASIALTTGVMDAFSFFFHYIKMDWFIPVIGLLIVFGTLGKVAAWIVGPSKGLLATANAGDLPPFLARTNRRHVPTNILLIQGAVVTVLSGLFLLMPTLSSAFFLLTALTVILYLIMYILMYAAAIQLRYSHPRVMRGYRVPGGNAGMWVVSGVGIMGALFALIVGFFPPEQLSLGRPTFYFLFLVCGVVVALGIAYLIIGLRKPSWKKKIED